MTTFSLHKHICIPVARPIPVNKIQQFHKSWSHMYTIIEDMTLSSVTIFIFAGAEILGGQGVLKPPHFFRWGGRALPLSIFGLPEEVFALLAHPLLAYAN